MEFYMIYCDVSDSIISLFPLFKAQYGSCNVLQGIMPVSQHIIVT